MKYLSLLLLCLSQDAAERLFGRIVFEKAQAADDPERRVLEVLVRKDHWLAGIRAVEEKVGRFPDALGVRVGFDWPEEEYAHGGSGPGGGWIRFNLTKLGEYQKKIDQLEQQRREEEAKGRRVVFRIPPARLDRIIWHELTHVLQGDLEAPPWFREGMAVWVSEDSNALLALASGGKAVGSITTEPTERLELYGRGHLLWKWLDSRGLAQRVARETVVERKRWKPALVEATGLDWEALVAEEMRWSAAEVQKLRSPAKGSRP